VTEGPPSQHEGAAPAGEDAEALYEDAPCGYVSTTPAGELLTVNRTLLSWTGYTREEMLGRRFQDLLTTGGRIYHETHFAPLLRMQGAVREIALEIVCADGRRLPVLVNSILRTDAAGEPRLVRTTVFDATQRRRYERELLRAGERERAARRRMERLQRLSAVLAAAVDTRAMAAAVVDALASDLDAGEVALALVDQHNAQLQIVGRHGAPRGSGDGDLSEAASAPLERIMRDGQTLLWSADTASDEPPPAGLAIDPVQALAVLPLAARGEPMGAILLSFDAPRQFGEEELAFMDACAGQCSQALERARLYDNQRTIARTLQQSLLADDPPRDTRFGVASCYLPAGDTLDVGGDWHDTFCVGDGSVGVVIGDVVGRGIEAATAMGQLRSATRALAGAGLGPAEVLAQLDGFVERLPRARMATVAYGELDLDTGQLRYASAGHLPMLFMAPGEPARLLWDGRGMPLGTRLGPRADAVGQVALPPGGRLMLFTDGLIEHGAAPIDEGLATLLAKAEAGRSLPIGVLLDELVAEGVGGDDTCLLCVEYTPAAGSRAGGP
jgi:serine/threonine-protein kinase RsbW